MFRIALMVAALFLTVGSVSTASAQNDPRLPHDNLHQQPWIRATNGDLRQDMLLAAAEGKTLMILWEQEGCYYCGKLHKNNFSRTEIVDILNNDYLVVQLDLRGDGLVTDFNGEKMTESKLARRWRVTTTPTTLALSSQNPMAKSLEQAEIFRLPGYLEPFEYLSVIDYVASGAYSGKTLTEFMQIKSEEFAERGVDSATW